MIVFLGQPALSAFRLERINAQIGALAPVAVKVARKIFLLKTPALDESNLRRASALLDAESSANVSDIEKFSLFVFPRLGTFSPWSSKASEILRGAKINVDRAEAGVVYELTGFDSVDFLTRSKIEKLLHDPMTQSVLRDQSQLSQCFELGEPQPLAHIRLNQDANHALQSANLQLGLALSSDEIEYLANRYGELGRDPSDAELMMFAQANSEHCRHKVFNASWRIDGQAQSESLFGMIKHTHKIAPAHTLSAYSDNAAIIEGAIGTRFFADPSTAEYQGVLEPIHYAIKVETHNHPTAISPFAGASTGSGGEIRDEGAVGRGGKPKAGLCGFSVSNLRIPNLDRPWEIARVLPTRMASAFEIMRDGPLGAAAFNNEFGRPNLLGYFRSFECAGSVKNFTYGYDKPIMIAGGLANVRASDVHKRELKAGDVVIVLGGPAMLIGLGGGAASSVNSGESSEALDYASVQRDNPEMERRCQEVIDRCWAMGANNPIVSIHDVGAGGLSNAIPELLNDSKVGGELQLRQIPCADPSLSPMQIWCNESQERYVLGIHPDNLDLFRTMCERERCPFAVLGHATLQRHLRVSDQLLGVATIDLPMDVLFGKAPKMLRDTHRRALSPITPTINLNCSLDQAARLVLSHPSVGSKSFLITIGDRSVGGLCSRDQMVGPWQVPVADCAVTLLDYDSHLGEAMSMGERTPLALVNAAASARMAIGEALTNLAAAPVADLSEVRMSANWMASVSHPGEDAALFDAVHAVGKEICPQLGISIPVGKDSLSMQTRWQVNSDVHQVVSPVSLIVSAFARVEDVRKTSTPQLQTEHGESELFLLDLGAGKNRMAGSILQQCLTKFNAQSTDAVPDLDDASLIKKYFALIQALRQQNLLLAYHDRSDGGAFATACEMAFAGRAGLDIELDQNQDALMYLFNEELGALVQIRSQDIDAFNAIVQAHELGGLVKRFARVTSAHQMRVLQKESCLANWALSELIFIWHETSHAMQKLRDHPDCADSERDLVHDFRVAGISPLLTFDINIDVAAPYIARGIKPKVAILREQGVNSQVEMARAFSRAGFAAFDIHMSDLISGRANLRDYQGLVACGGFSYGDVLGAGRGWAGSILYQNDLHDQFSELFANTQKFALGVCNGCQMMAELASIIPGAKHWPRLKRNRSEQYEARFVTVEVLESPSLFFTGMQGSRIPVAVAHGEGFAQFSDQNDLQNVAACWRFVDDQGRATQRYPLNPNGSPMGLTGFTNSDGRITILMPHPERVFRSAQMSWHPKEWGEDSPWLRMFRNARVFVG